VSTAPSAAVQLKLAGTEKYVALSKRLKAAGRGDLQRELTRAIRKEGQPALRAVQAAWRTVDVKSLAPNDRGGVAPPDTSTGLRNRVARATRLQVRRRGIAISVNGERVDPKYPTLVYYLNGLPRRRDWRHKVFNRQRKADDSFVWVAQKGQEVFAPTLLEFAPEWRRGVKDTMERAARKIEG
jgi:hypothetical protein